MNKFAERFYRQDIYSVYCHVTEIVKEMICFIQVEKNKSIILSNCVISYIEIILLIKNV